MFKVVERKTDGNTTSKHEYELNDVKDIWDLIVGITGDRTEAKRAMLIAANMRWDDEFYSGVYNSYYIECIRK